MNGAVAKRVRLRTPRVGGGLGICLAALLVGILPPQASAVPTTGASAGLSARTLVVDNGETQCPDKSYDTISAAVDDADPGDVVRVCPGVYVEQVTVRKSLTIRGDAETIEAVDCFSPTRPDTDSNTQAIVTAASTAPGESPAVLFDLQADNIELQGFVLQGAVSNPPLFARAVQTSSTHSGYRVHHNLIQANTVGIFARSSGEFPSNFDHNCLRENGWGLVNSNAPLVNARVHHNSTFRTANFAFEETAGAGGEGVVNQVTFDHNVSRADEIAYRFAGSMSTVVFENDVQYARIGMRLAEATRGLRIVGNRITAQLTGLAAPSNFPANVGVHLQGNTITASAPGGGTVAGIGMGNGALKDSQILDNTIHGMSGSGIVLLTNNTGNLVRGNSVLRNGGIGIHAAGASGNIFESNQMLGNGTTSGVDARDDVRESNTWRDNLCETDIPVGTICGVQ